MTKSSIFACCHPILAVLTILTCSIASVCDAQRPRFPDFFQAQPPTGAGVINGQPPFTNPGFVPGNQGVVFPGSFNQGQFISPPPATIATPAIDPFQGGTQALPFNNPGIAPANTSPVIQFPPQNVQVLPPLQPQTQNFQQPGFFNQPSPQFGVQQPFNSQPLFGSGQFGNGGGAFPRAGQTGSFFRRFRNEYLPRLLERPRIRHTYLAGSNGNELQIHDLEFATTLTFPRLLFSEQPVRITPGFIAHFWDGPQTLGAFGTGFDLPETAFSAFLTMEHFSDPNQRAGIESNFTVGIYSDYEHLDSDSLRLSGVGLGWVRLNETNIFKFGVEYFDRLNLKLLPAFGLFIRPTNDLQLDLYFPRPRIAQRLPNLRSLESWLYIAGEYGGGNWTVQRDFGDDRIDINDFRAILGIEWYGQRGVTGFVETGYVFDRELISQAAVPSRRLELQDTIMVRMGLEF